MACKCGRNKASQPAPINNPVYLIYNGKRDTPFGYRGMTGRHYHVIPGEPLAVDQDDRDAMLGTGLFQPAQDALPDDTVRSARRDAWLWTMAYLGDSMDVAEYAIHEAT